MWFGSIGGNATGEGIGSAGRRTEGIEMAGETSGEVCWEVDKGGGNGDRWDWEDDAN
jgi:hypothetical protein